MSSDKTPVTIKKYANRRLYNTGTSAYVTLDDLAGMVKRGEDFVVYDAKSSEDITRSVLTQIIFEQENKNGQSLLPITFLRQLIRFYGDSMQMLVPSYLEFSLDKLTKERGGFGALFSNGALTSAARPMFAQLEEQTRQNMALFRDALSMFTPFPAGGRPAAAEPPAHDPPTPDAHAPSPSSEMQATSGMGELEEMRRQLDDLQRRIEGLATKP
jgi:polyhydroxyalkanoate synthesis repressor PhaR